MASLLQNHLLESIAKMYDDGDAGHDVEVVVGLALQSERFKAHGMILRAVSPLFKKMLTTEPAEMENGRLVLKLPDVTPPEFNIILKYIYTGSVAMEDVLRYGVLAIVIAAEKLELNVFLEHVQNELIRKHRDWLKSHLTDVLRSISDVPSCKRLYDHCQDLEGESSSSSLGDSYDILRTHLEHEFVVNQIEAWEKIINWGVSQLPGLEKDPETWTEAESGIIKERIKDLVPLLRFTKISPVDFCRKIMPYKRIVSKILFKHILYLYLDPKNSALNVRKLLQPEAAQEPRGREIRRGNSPRHGRMEANNYEARTGRPADPETDRSTWINAASNVTNICLHGDHGLTFPFRPSDYTSIAAFVNIKYQAISILFNDHVEARIPLQKIENITHDGSKVVIKLTEADKIKYFHHPGVFPSIPHTRTQEDPTPDGSLRLAQTVVLMLDRNAKMFCEAVQIINPK